jgi:hypothetical protein
MHLGLKMKSRAIVLRCYKSASSHHRLEKADSAWMQKLEFMFAGTILQAAHATASCSMIERIDGSSGYLRFG